MRPMYLFLVLALSSMSLTIAAQNSLSGSITLRDALEATRQAHPRLRSFPLREEALRGQRETADLNPPLHITAGVEEVFGTGDLRDFSSAEVSIGLSQVIELGNKRETRVGVVDRRIDLLAAQERVAVLDLFGEVVLRFIEVAATQERLLLQQQAREIAAQTVELLQPLVTAGQTSQLELDRAQAALVRAENAVQMAAAMLESARIRLATMWMSIEPQFDRVATDLLAVGEVTSISTLLASLESNPDVVIYGHETRLREAELRQAQALRQSDIQWSAGIRHLREINDTGFTAGVSIPLFSGTRASGAIREAYANLEEVETRRQVVLNRLQGEIVALHQQLQQAVGEVASLENEVLPRLESVLEQAQAAYETGSYSYLELISAQDEYLDAELALINRAAAAHKLRAEIEILSGEPLLAE